MNIVVRIHALVIRMIFVLMLTLWVSDAMAQSGYSMMQCQGGSFVENYYGKSIRSVINTRRYLSDNSISRDTILFDSDGKYVQRLGWKPVESYYDTVTGEDVKTFVDEKDWRLEVRDRIDSVNNIHFSSSTIYKKGLSRTRCQKVHRGAGIKVDTIFSRYVNLYDDRGGDTIDWKIDEILDSSNVDTIVRYQFGSEDLRSKSKSWHVGDTDIVTKVEYCGTSSARKPCIYELYRNYPGRTETFSYWIEDSTLIESQIVEYGQDGLVRQVTNYKKALRRCKDDPEPYSCITTYKYRFNRKHIWKQERIYIDGALVSITKRKLSYYK